MKSSMRVLVTGGAGRLGINVCKILLGEGFQVRVFDLDTPGNRQNVGELDGRAEIFWGDITREDSVCRAVSDIDAVVHMAAILPPVAYEKPELAHEVNVGGTKILVDLMKAKGGHIPFVFTSSVAVFGPTPGAEGPVSVDNYVPKPVETYGETKLKAEEVIRESGIDYLILRLTAIMYLSFDLSDMNRIFSIPLDNRLEFCHPDDLAVAIGNALKSFDTIKGNTLVISGGPEQRMLFKDMVGGVLGVMGLPLPPEDKFTREPYFLDWYDTTKSQELLKFQGKGYTDYLKDFSLGLTRRYTKLFLPAMRYFVSPLFGTVVLRLICRG